MVEGWPELHWHLPWQFSGWGSSSSTKTRASNFSGRRPHQISRRHHISAPVTTFRLPCASRTESDTPHLSCGTRCPVCKLSACVNDTLQTPSVSIENRQHGWRNVAHTGGFFFPPSTGLPNISLAIQIHISLHEANIATISPEIFACRTCHLSESPLHPGHT